MGFIMASITLNKEPIELTEEVLKSVDENLSKEEKDKTIELMNSYLYNIKFSLPAYKLTFSKDFYLTEQYLLKLNYMRMKLGETKNLPIMNLLNGSLLKNSSKVNDINFEFAFTQSQQAINEIVFFYKKETFKQINEANSLEEKIAKIEKEIENQCSDCGWNWKYISQDVHDNMIPKKHCYMFQDFVKDCAQRRELTEEQKQEIEDQTQRIEWHGGKEDEE